MRALRWGRCVSHRGEDAANFLREFFATNDRRVLVIGGGGFDPRSTNVSEQLVAIAGLEKVRGFFLREERSAPHAELVERADKNVSRLRELIPTCGVVQIEVFAAGGVVVGGRRAVAAISDFNFDCVTDVVVDLSALSVGVAFPVVRHLLGLGLKANIHVMVTDETNTDAAIVTTPSDSADTMAGFKGGFGLSEHEEAARLWLPQLVEGRRVILERIHAHVQPDDVCPILPFPADNPRRPDRLIAEYGEQFESVWHVDFHNIVYADEKNPLDLYRTILRLDELRERVFKDIGGSLTILSPMGSKVLAIGALLAAIERDFPVVHVEAVSYAADLGRLDSRGRGSSRIWQAPTR
ncbi:MAG: hypothetical protein K8T20_15150, partial [Planctomycetes bacterium]|nr:hypothetical protein [Planctomycetota bacterium]